MCPIDKFSSDTEVAHTYIYIYMKTIICIECFMKCNYNIKSNIISASNHESSTGQKPIYIYIFIVVPFFSILVYTVCSLSFKIFLNSKD